MTIKLNPVESSNIKAIGSEGSTVHIQFQNGAVYEYTDVDARDIDGLFSADSVGKYFNGIFRQNNEGVRIDIIGSDNVTAAGSTEVDPLTSVYVLWRRS